MNPIIPMKPSARSEMEKLCAFPISAVFCSLPIGNYAVGTAKSTTETRWTQRKTKVCIRSEQSPFSDPASASQSSVFSVYLVSLWFIKIVPNERLRPITNH